MPATELPTWAVYAVSFGTPAAAFAGAAIGHIVTRRGATELEKRSRREQLMKTLQWAAELAISDDEAKANLGVSQLVAVTTSDLCDKDVQEFVDAALVAVLGNLPDEIETDPDAVVQPIAPARDTGDGKCVHTLEGRADRWVVMP
ncbi:hypothetical protein AB0J83_01420 [Actinoplanes sp. NPDC049596]|uniref:hypothetical protein n=1 Tax=unclassified Actinoplanes TaxID=2626549 RepID=UPI003445F7C7